MSRARLAILAAFALIAGLLAGTAQQSTALADGGAWTFTVANTFDGTDDNADNPMEYLVTTVLAVELSADGKTVLQSKGADSSSCSASQCRYQFTLTPGSGTQVRVYSMDMSNDRSGSTAVPASGATVTIPMTALGAAKVTGSVSSSDGVTLLSSARVVVKDASGVVEFVTQTVGATTKAYALGDFLAQATDTKGTVTVTPPQGDTSHGSERTWATTSGPGFRLDGRNLFGRVLGPGSGLDSPGSAEAVTSLQVHRVDASGNKTLVASSVVGEVAGSVKRIDLTANDADLGVGAFGTEVDFGSNSTQTFELTVVPVDGPSGGTTVFRLPGPIGSKASPMTFRLEPKQGPGLMFKSRQWACRYASDVNCVVSLEARPKGSNGAWTAAPLERRSYAEDIGSLGTGGAYLGWDRYETFKIPAIGSVAAQDAYAQFFLRPMNDGAPDPVGDPYPYVIIELYEQSDSGELRDGWGCDGTGQTWTGEGAGSPCRGSAILSDELEYRVKVRTAGTTFQPIFVAGYLSGMRSELTGTAATQFEMSVSGAPRPWQWIGDDPPSDYYDATNLDWSFSAYDGREVASMGSEGIVSCIGLGVAASTTNGNGSSMPDWNEDTSTLLYNTQGRHKAPDGITKATNPTTNAPYAKGDVYVGQAEITLPVTLGQCLWQQSGAQLANLDGQVLDSDGNSKNGADVDVSVADGYLTVTASGFSYSTADLVVKPKAANSAGSSGSGSGAGSSDASSQESSSSGTGPASQKPPASTPSTPATPSTPRPLNPPTAQPIAPGLILPSQAEASALQPTVTRDPPATQFSSAPVVRATAGSPVAVTAPGLPASTTFTVQIRQAGGTYVTVANVTTDARGNAVLPAFQATRPGTYRIALVDPSSGQVRYVKVVVKARR